MGDAMRLVGKGAPKKGPEAARNRCGTCRYWGKQETLVTVARGGRVAPCLWAVRSRKRPAWIDAARIGAPAFGPSENQDCPVWEAAILQPTE